MLGVEPNPNEDDDLSYGDQVLRILEHARKIVYEKLQYDESRREAEFSENDLVLVYKPTRKVGRSEKLLHRWHGPYRVIKRITPLNYEVKLINGRKSDIVHVVRIKAYKDPSSQLAINSDENESNCRGQQEDNIGDEWDEEEEEKLNRQWQSARNSTDRRGAQPQGQSPTRQSFEGASTSSHPPDGGPPPLENASPVRRPGGGREGPPLIEPPVSPQERGGPPPLLNTHHPLAGNQHNKWLKKLEQRPRLCSQLQGHKGIEKCLLDFF